MCSNPNARGLGREGSGIASRPSARGAAESFLGTSSKPKGKSEGTGGASPCRPKGRSRGLLEGVVSGGSFAKASSGDLSSLPHAGHDEEPDETSPQIGHSYTMPAVRTHASRCRKR